jgi:hypothetical protein
MKRKPHLRAPSWRPVPRPKRVPRPGADPDAYYGQRPSWRVRRMEMADPFGWHRLDPRTLRAVRDKLGNFETMTWREILGAAGGQNHFISVDKLVPEARRRLIQLKLEDIDELLSLRLSGKQRVWGILSEGVAALLWWDPDHRICPSRLKHT